ncbi:hypothetical protein GH714_011972 [Hevea brasiliensis]|uniref:Uncharacterized protein n=1 Tax=Hevea brasiliensis TaxID=3981 RepID=A0A6A6N0M8_HEVBR|nr:hypothetical protein GH714_011972 [Hevea brasiliensis]
MVKNRWLRSLQTFKGGGRENVAQGSPTRGKQENMVKGAPARSLSQGTSGSSHPQGLGKKDITTRTMDKRSRVDKKEEANLAVALSRVEDWRRLGYRYRTDNDEELARALRDGLNPSGYPPHAPPQHGNIGYS